MCCLILELLKDITRNIVFKAEEGKSTNRKVVLVIRRCLLDAREVVSSPRSTHSWLKKAELQQGFCFDALLILFPVSNPRYHIPLVGYVSVSLSEMPLIDVSHSLS